MKSNKSFLRHSDISIFLFSIQKLFLLNFTQQNEYLPAEAINILSECN